jgi:signal transduction histidine kinase
MNGAPVDAHVGRTVREVVPAVATLAESVAQEILANGLPKLDVEFSGETPQQPGVQRYWREQWAPVKDASGRVVAITIAVDEITERKRVQSELAANRVELQERIEELEALMGSVPAAILIAQDRRCAVITGNADAHALFRIPPGQPITDEGIEIYEGAPFSDVPPRRLSRGDYPMERVAATAEPIRHIELTLVFSDGEERLVTGSALPLLSADGSVRGVIAAFNDITDRKRAEQRLAQEMRNKDAFLSTLSHEVRTPLSALANGVEILRQLAGGDAKAGEVIAMMARQQKHLARLIDDLLDVSKLGRGEISLRLTRVDVSQCVRDVVHATEAELAAKGQTIHFSPSPEPVMVEGDAARITQVITNLVVNAHKYSPADGTIAVSTRREGDEVVLTVADSGSGLSAEVLPRIFEQFFTTASAPWAKGGLGIGLWLSRELVKLHRGTIAAANCTPGPGACFTVRLPGIA